ncbi:hypothetical protein AB185_13925 [Klebsiella oxytoca]|nr:hypothetical protein AB185_13925 [Klebsiella oxytoca]
MKYMGLREMIILLLNIQQMFRLKCWCLKKLNHRILWRIYILTKIHINHLKTNIQRQINATMLTLMVRRSSLRDIIV